MYAVASVEGHPSSSFVEPPVDVADLVTSTHLVLLYAFVHLSPKISCSILAASQLLPLLSPSPLPLVPFVHPLTAHRSWNIGTFGHGCVQSHRSVTRVRSISSPGLFIFLVLVSIGLAASTIPFCEDLVVLGTMFWCYNTDEVSICAQPVEILCRRCDDAYL